MNDFLEYEQTKKTIKALNIHDFSIEDFKKYISELRNEINRVEKDIETKTGSVNKVQKFF